MKKIIISTFIFAISAGLSACDEEKGAATSSNSVMPKYAGPTGPVVVRTYDQILKENLIKEGKTEAEAEAVAAAERKNEAEFRAKMQKK